jgi:hypothetical protein
MADRKKSVHVVGVVLWSGVTAFNRLKITPKSYVNYGVITMPRAMHIA